MTVSMIHIYTAVVVYICKIVLLMSGLGIYVLRIIIFMEYAPENVFIPHYWWQTACNLSEICFFNIKKYRNTHAPSTMYRASDFVCL